MTSRPDDSRAYALRNAVHVLLSAIAAGVVYLSAPVTAAIILAGATLVALAVELLRRVSVPAAGAFQRRLGRLLKEGEAARLTGATTLAVGFTLTAVAFPGGPALAGILFAGLGDPVASMVGRRAGGLRFPGGKSVAGSGAFLVVVLAVGLALGASPAVAFLTAVLATVVEAFTLPIDDNLYLPLAGAAALALVG